MQRGQIELFVVSSAKPSWSPYRRSRFGTVALSAGHLSAGEKVARICAQSMRSRLCDAPRAYSGESGIRRAYAPGLCVSVIPLHALVKPIGAYPSDGRTVRAWRGDGGLLGQRWRVAGIHAVRAVWLPDRARRPSTGVKKPQAIHDSGPFAFCAGWVKAQYRQYRYSSPCACRGSA